MFNFLKNLFRRKTRDKRFIAWEVFPYKFHRIVFKYGKGEDAS